MAEPTAPESPAPPPEPPPDAAAAEAAPPEEKKKKKDGLSRGVETLYRNAYRTHLDLSSQADEKANLMLGLSGLVASLGIGFGSLVAADTALRTACGILIVGALISLTFAMRAARPRVTRLQIGLEDVRANKTSLLFFGQFVTLSREDYIEGMRELMRRPELLYDNMSRDLYALGFVLERKYRLLRIAYDVFTGTLVLAAATWLFVVLRG
jgi:hypothetical protein